jgi:hypothetical protein
MLRVQGAQPVASATPVDKKYSLARRAWRRVPHGKLLFAME